MSVNAVNANAINEVSFPGAEQGLSLIELVGTVVVTCSITTVYLGRTASAQTTAKATGTSGSVHRLQLAASTAGAATPTASVRSKVPYGATGAAACVGTAGIAIRSRLGAAIAATGAGEVGSYLRVVKGATGTAQAVVTNASGRTKVSRSVTTKGAATGTVLALRRVRFTIASRPASAGTARATLRRRLSLAGVGQASGSVLSTGSRAPRGAAVVAQAAASAVSIKYITAGPATTAAQATPTPAGVRLLLPFAAGGQPLASGVAALTLRLLAGAYANPTATATAAGTEFNADIPAPAERSMTLPVSDRRMEVTT